MELPIRLSSAHELLKKYLNTVGQNAGRYDDIETVTIEKLNQLQQNCENISRQMLNALGYSGSRESMEKQLNEAIKILHQNTLHLNGQELYEFILKDLSEAIAYSPKYQFAYEQWLDKWLKGNDFDTLDKDTLEIVGDMFADALINIGSVTSSKTQQTQSAMFYITINTDSNIARGYNRRTGGSTGAFVLSRIFTDQKSQSIRKKLLEVLKRDEFNITTANNDLIISIPIDDKNIYNMLKVSNTPDRATGVTIQELIQLDPTIITRVNESMIKKIMSAMTYPSNLMKQCIQEVLDKHTGKETAFFVGNNINAMTGILGEIQGLYYIRSILQGNRKKIDDSTVKWVGGMGNPHADLILEALGQGFGIQIKNTSEDINQLRMKVSFESFQSDLVKNMENHNVGVTWLKAAADSAYNATIAQNPELFDALTGLIGMEKFNIPYEWVNNSAIRVDSVPDFNPTRLMIEAAADKARRILAQFLIGMMYMQLAPIDTSGNSSTLYIIGGTLAITSATLIQDIINDIKGAMQNINFELRSAVDKTKGKKEGSKELKDIVEFLNAGAGQHLSNTRYILESSYTFQLPPL